MSTEKRRGRKRDVTPNRVFAARISSGKELSLTWNDAQGNRVLGSVGVEIVNGQPVFKVLSTSAVPDTLVQSE